MSKKGMFNRGYKFAREEAERQEQARANVGKLIFEFFLKADKKNRSPEADVIFLTDEPINFYMHNIPKANGKFESIVCSEVVANGECIECDKGDRPSYKGAYLIYDERPYEYTDKNGKTVKKEGQIKLYFAGARVMSQLDRINTKKGLLHRECTIVRTGTGTGTSYTIEVGDEIEFTRKELANLFADLHDDIKEMFDGSTESLYDIIEEQLRLRMRDEDDEVEDEDNEDEYEEDGYDDTLVGDEDEDEDDIPFDVPKKKKSLFKRSAASSIKKSSSKPKIGKKFSRK